MPQAFSLFQDAVRPGGGGGSRALMPCQLSLLKRGTEMQEARGLGDGKFRSLTSKRISSRTQDVSEE